MLPSELVEMLHELLGMFIDIDAELDIHDAPSGAYNERYPLGNPMKLSLP